MIRRLCAGTAVSLVAALLLVACGAGSGSGGTASGARTSDPAAAGAQNLRVSIDLALSGHVMLLGRTTGAALGVRTTEFSAYGTALHADDAHVADAIAPGHDTPGQNRIASALTAFDKGALNYATAVYTKDAGAQQQAQAEMSTTYASQMQTALQSVTHANPASLNRELTQQVTDTRTLIGAQASGDWTTAYSALGTAYAHSVSFGTALAQAMARTAPGTYPGNPTSKDADLRTALETALQAQVYLLGMAEAAGAGQRTTEQPAAAAAYAASTTALGQAIDPAGTKLATAVTGNLTQAQAAAVGLAQATAQKDVAGVDTDQKALTQTLPQDYLAVAHGRLRIPKKQAQAASMAFGQALAGQAGAEGRQEGTPQLAATAATAGATLGRQLSAALRSRYPAVYPTA
ncbi:MAG: hypothetical protein ACREQM_02480 [Candidatus Dormibacteraceae bacterium]